MKRSLLAVLCALTFAGCNQATIGMMTAPGTELPAFFDICDAHDEIGRCAKWRYGNGRIRPYDVPPADHRINPTPGNPPKGSSE